MKRLPLRHVPLFWIGLLPVVILLWAWADSVNSDSAWLHEFRGESVEFRLCASLLEVGLRKPVPIPGREDPMPPADKHENFFRREARAAGGAAQYFPRPHYWHSWIATDRSIYEMHTYTTRIPLWLILLCWLPLWIAATWWQVRRKARSLEEVPGDR